MRDLPAQQWCREGDHQIISSLRNVLAGNTPDAKRIRTPQNAEVIVRACMEAIIQSWFLNTTWATYQNVLAFLDGNVDNKVRVCAMSSLCVKLKSDALQLQAVDAENTRKHASDAIHRLVSLLIKIAQNTLGHPCSNVEWSHTLAMSLNKAGHLQVVKASRNVA